MMTEPRFHVLLDPDHNLDQPTPLAKELAPILDMVEPDLSRRLRYGAGWIARSLKQSVAEEVTKVCAELQLPVHAVEAPAEVNERYLERLDPALVRALNARAGDLIERLGYERIEA